MVVINDITYTKLTTYTGKVGGNEAYTFNAIPDEQYYSKPVKLVSFYHDGTEKIIITEIGKNAFTNCHLIPSVVIPKTILVIRENAFLSCHWLRSITFEKGSSLTTIETNAFASVYKIPKEVRLPFHLRTIASNAFTQGHFFRFFFRFFNSFSTL